MDEVRGKKQKPIKTKPEWTLYGQGNANMVHASGKDIALPELIKMGSWVGYHYHPKGAVNPIIGNGRVEDFKEMPNGGLAYKIVGKNGYTIWIPEGNLTTVNKLTEGVYELNLYHGSQNKQEFDHFDFAYLSSGWGQQAYGYGFYLTDNPDCARQYAGGGRIYQVEVPDGKYLSYKSISLAEKRKIANALYKYYTEEDEYGKEAYPTPELKREFWNEECKYIMDCEDGGDVYGTAASILGSDKMTSEFFSRLGYVGVKFPETDGDTGKKFMNYVIFKQEDIKILKSDPVQ